jgi:hypothetical protein
VPFGAAGRNLRIPGTAIALSQGTDPGGHETAADDPAIELPWRVKAETFFHLTPNIGYPLMIVVSADAAGDDRALLHGWLEMLLIDLPLIAASFWSISAFTWSRSELFPNNWKRSHVPATGHGGRCGLTIINTKAFFEALVGYQTAFARTPKYGAQKTSAANVQYRRRSGWLPYAELAAVRFPGDYRLRDPVVQLPGDSVPAVVRRRLLLGRRTTFVEQYQGKLAFDRQRELAASQQAQAAKA